MVAFFKKLKRLRVKKFLKNRSAHFKTNLASVVHGAIFDLWRWSASLKKDLYLKKIRVQRFCIVKYQRPTIWKCGQGSACRGRPRRGVSSRISGCWVHHSATFVWFFGSCWVAWSFASPCYGSAWCSERTVAGNAKWLDCAAGRGWPGRRLHLPSPRMS